jgi:hypothetical protein
MTALTDVLRVLEGSAPIPKDEVVTWLTDADIEVAGAAHAYLAKVRHASRVTPPLGDEEFARLSVEFLKRCLVAPHDGEWADSQFEAAWALVSWLGRESKKESSCAREFVHWLGDTYKAQPAVRIVIETGLLEHALGSKSVDQVFGEWKRDPDLSGALARARGWKSGGGQSPIDL